MKIIIEKDEHAMSESAMQIILGTMMQDKKVNVSLTSGSSPRTMYQMMVPYVKDKPQFHISLICDVSPNCDCHAENDAPIVPNIGMLASFDMVALDKACLDLIYNSNDEGRDHFIERVESRNGIHLIETAANKNLGNIEYELIDVDKKRGCREIK